MKDLDIKKLEKLINDGLTLKEISCELQISISSVKRKMNKHGFNSKLYSLKKEKIRCLNCQEDFEALISENRKFCSG